MELGNLLFGNSRGKYEIPRDFVELKEWQNLLKKLDANSTYGYINKYKGNVLPGENGGCIVKNNESVIFKIMPYYWGECTCGAEIFNYKLEKKLYLEHFTKEEIDTLDKNYYDCDEKCPAYEKQYDVEDEKLVKICTCGAIKKNIVIDENIKKLQPRYNDLKKELQENYKEHSENCLLVQHNFVFLPDTENEVWIDWYKYPFRDSYSNIKITKEIFSEILNECIKNIK